MRTLLVCRGPIAFETLELYQRYQWLLPHVIISSKEWVSELQRTAPWTFELPSSHVHYVQEYNDVEAILEIAAANRIDAIYPGYGFLAESADFAERVQSAGIRFIGPTPEALRSVGDKDAAIALAKQLDIPTIPGDDSLVAYAQNHPPIGHRGRDGATHARHGRSPSGLSHPSQAPSRWRWQRAAGSLP